jgi:predicted GNAT superfamily acetyltransferase
MTNSDAIVLRDIDQLSEMREIEQIQRTIWGVNDLDVLPALALRPLKEVGAILIGAFDRDRLIGFVFGFPGRVNGENIIHSDMLGVLPEYRSLNLGFRLKVAQRERALSTGIETITWTYDPLRAVNASLNFARLGVTANRYEIDYYGETSSVLHRLGTDRLWVTWSLNSERVANRIGESGSDRRAMLPDGRSALLVTVGDQQQPLLDLKLNGNAVLIEIPRKLDELLSGRPDLAADWRNATRNAFTSALQAGYVVEDFVIDKAKQKGTYVLKR